VAAPWLAYESYSGVSMKWLCNIGGVAAAISAGMSASALNQSI